MFISKKHLSRRTFLHGAGVTLALPFLEAMVPRKLHWPGQRRIHAQSMASFMYRWARS